MRYCHSVRGHPECDGIYNDWGVYLPLAPRQDQPQTALPGCSGAFRALQKDDLLPVEGEAAANVRTNCTNTETKKTHPGVLF